MRASNRNSKVSKIAQLSITAGGSVLMRARMVEHSVSGQAPNPWSIRFHDHV
jgi:hypothetical protein